MRNINKLCSVMIVLASVTAIGCDGKYPAVSGKVTSDGEPVPMVRVVFTPTAVGDNHIPGPYSVGVTDGGGNYTLKTRYKEQGAVAGPHKVGFEWADIEFDSMSGLKAELREGVADAARKAYLEKSIEEIKQKLSSRPKLRPNLIKTFDVPSEGTSSADFELAETSD